MCHPRHGITLQLTDVVPEYAAFQWYRDGVAIPGATNPSFVAFLPGDYDIEVFNGVGDSEFSNGAVTIPECPEISLTKTQTGGANPATVAGQVLNYQIVLENLGNVPNTNIVASDTLPDGSAGTLSGPVESILPANGDLDVGETWTYTIDYTVSQDDMDAGTTLVNTVSVVTDQVPGPTQDNAQTPITQNPGINIVKSSVLNDPNSDGFAQAGETIDYTFTVTNTGNVSLDRSHRDRPAAGPVCHHLRQRRQRQRRRAGS